jgi:type I restriction enzyme S subunit
MELPAADDARPLPRGWRIEPIGNLCNLLNGNAYKEPDWSSDGVPIIRIQNLNDPTKPFNYWRGPLDGRVTIKKGDLLFAWSGTPGTSFGAHEWSGPLAMLNQHIFRVDLRPGVDRTWMKYALTHALPAIIAKSHGGVGLRHINRGELSSCQIIVPPFSEQRRIAAALDAQLAAIARARAAVEAELASLALAESGALAAAFGRRPISADVEGQGTGAAEWILLTDVAKLESGHTPSRKHPEWWGGDVPWIALPDIRDLDGRLAERTIETTNGLGLANSSARLLPTGTVCLSRTASVGYVTVMGRPMATSQDFVNWVCGERILPWYLAHALIASRSYLLTLASGAIHKTIYVPTVKQFRILLPTMARQQQIIERVDAIRECGSKTRNALTAQLSALDALPAALLRAAFSGAL